jgi:hypothetical protein
MTPPETLLAAVLSFPEMLAAETTVAAGSRWAERVCEYVRDYKLELDADVAFALASGLWLEVTAGPAPRIIGTNPNAIEHLSAQLQWALVPYRAGTPLHLHTLCMRVLKGKRMLLRVDDGLATGDGLTGRPTLAIADAVHGIDELPADWHEVPRLADEIEAELDFGGGVRRRMTLAELLRGWNADAEEMATEWYMVLPAQPTAHAAGHRLLARSALVRQYTLLNARYPRRSCGLMAIGGLRAELAERGEDAATEQADMLARSFAPAELERPDMGRGAFAAGIRTLAGEQFEGMARAADRASDAWQALHEMVMDGDPSAAELDAAYEALLGRERVLLDALGRVARGAA